MAIYGHSRCDDDDDEAGDPQLLTEVSFQLSPDDLRRIATFLVTCAERIEAGTFIDGGRHLRDHDRRWDAQGAGDVIVVPPPPGAVKTG